MTVLLAVRLAFEFLVPTAARWSEVRWAEWTEINRAEGVWTVRLGGRSRTGSTGCRCVATRWRFWTRHDRSWREFSPFLFPNRVGKQLEEKQLRRMFQKHGIAAVPHGFRASFRDWAAEETDHPREVIEAAYRRTDLFERRRLLMDDWAAYLAGENRDPKAGSIC